MPGALREEATLTERTSEASSIGTFYGAVKISSKGQIVIPQKVREDFGLRTGDQLLVLGRPEQEGFALLKPEGFLRVQQELARLQAQLGMAAAGAGLIDGAVDRSASET